MWGSKQGDGYSDQMYRDRNAGGFESKGKCCCFYLSKSVIVIFLVACIVSAGAASVLAVVFGYSQRWTYLVDRSVSGPAYNLRTGWLFFNDNRGVNKVKLDELSRAAYILGIVALVMNGISALAALYAALRATCGRLGRGYICFSIIFSILLVGEMLAYYIVTALNVYKYGQNHVQHGKFPWPDWAWCLGAGSALLWFISAGLTSAMPKKSKYFADEMEFQRQRNDPNRPYQIPPPAPAATPATGTPVNGYVPSTYDRQASNRSVPPMASQENTDYGGEEQPKKSFMPSWARRGSYNTSTEPNLPTAGGGSLKNRAEEIRDRYRNQNRSNTDLEMGGVSERPKSAW